MLNQVNQILDQAAARIVRSIGEFLPGLLAFFVVLVFTMSIAWILRFMIHRSLRRLEFDRHVDQWGMTSLSDWSPSHSPSRLIAGSVYWLLTFVGLLMAVSALDAALTSAMVLRLFDYLPNLVAAVIIIVAGILLARFLARSVLISSVNMQVQSARLLSLGVKWLVMVLAGAMALEQLGIGGQIVRLAFGILFGGIVFALALAVGLGSKDIVTRSLRRQADLSAAEEEESAHFHHL